MKWLYLSYFLGAYGKRYDSLDSTDFEFCTATEVQLPKLPFHYEPKEEAIRNILSGSTAALGFEWAWAGRDADWHYSPDTGQPWPKLFFDKIDYRQGNPFGDVRVAWEPSRLQHFIELALIAQNKPLYRDEAIKLLTQQLESWVRANPVGCGIHYISVMECGLRLMAVCYALDIARPYLEKNSAVWCAVAAIVSSHADLIRQRLSLHSSAGNHTVAECAGLVYAGLLFPEINDADDWLATGVSILSQEAERQVLSDGGGVERSPWYHLFVLDLLGLVVELLRFKGQAVPSEITGALVRGRRFIGVLAKTPTDLPRLGDADDGYALSPYLRLSWDVSAERKQVETFTDYGLTRVAVGGNGGGQLLLDHGALGMAPSYGHGHADALSLVLNVGERELLIDTGTFSYTGEPEWRSYFRSTSAHNTVCVDELDQAQQSTPFQWSRPYTSELVGSHVTNKGVVYLKMFHDGYKELGVTHVRYVVVIPDKLVIVRDLLEGKGQHKLDLYWHLAVNPVVDGDALHFYGNDQAASMRLWGGDFSLHRGELNPACGWGSMCYGVREPVTTIKKSYCGGLPYSFVTSIELTDECFDERVLKEHLDIAQSWNFERPG